MAKNVNLDNFGTLQNASIVGTLNSNSVLIENALKDCLSISGEQPNAMQSILDMNSNQIINLPAPSTSNSPVRLVDMTNGIQGPQGPPGPPGSGSFDTLAMAKAAHIPSLTNQISTAGYYAPGDGGGALYVRVSTPTYPAYFIQTADGAWWKYVPDARGISARAFGAKNDAVVAGGVVTGTDNAPFIQLAIDFSLLFGEPIVYLTSGQYYCGTTLQLGWGTSVLRIELQGDGGTVDSSIHTTALIFDKGDRPGINIQAGRNAGIRGLTIQQETNFYYLQVTQPVNAATLPLTAAGFVAPALTQALRSNAPLAGLTIDAYAGSAPVSPYPNLVFPQWVIDIIGSGQYNKTQSSQPYVLDCCFIGWPVCVSLAPNVDGQGDFLNVSRCTFQYFAYGINVNNSQSRNVTVDTNSFVFGHTMLTNHYFGVNNGFFAGPFDNCNASTCFQVFDFTSTVGPVLLRNFYFEDCVKIGQFLGNTTSPGLEFKGCTFNFYNSDMFYVPVAAVTGTAIKVRIERTFFNGSERIMPLFEQATIILGDGNTFFGAQEWSIGQISAIAASPNAPLVRVTVDSSRSWQTGDKRQIAGVTGAVGLNATWTITYIDDQHIDLQGSNFGSLAAYTGGGVVKMIPAWGNAVSYAGGYLLNVGGSGTIDDTVTLDGKSAVRGILTTDQTDATQIWGNLVSNPLIFQYREAIKSFVDLHGRTWEITGHTPYNVLLDKTDPGTLTSLAQTGDTLTFTYKFTNPQTDPNDFLIRLGDIITDTNTFTVYAITGITGGTAGVDYGISAQQCNNYSRRGGGFGSGTFTSNANVVTSGGLFRFIRTGTYLPQEVYFASFTSGSGTVSSVDRGDGFSAGAPAVSPTGTLLYSPPGGIDPLGEYPVAEGAFIGTYAGGGGSFTINNYAGSTVGTATKTIRAPLMPVGISAISKA